MTPGARVGVAAVGLLLCGALAGSLLAPRVARGKVEYFQAFAARYGTAGTRLHTCAVCHELSGNIPINGTLYVNDFAVQGNHSLDPDGAS